MYRVSWGSCRQTKHDFELWQREVKEGCRRPWNVVLAQIDITAEERGKGSLRCLAFATEKVEAVTRQKNFRRIK